MADSRTVVVAGAGIGGLTASLALAARGFRVVLLERNARLEEAGAGLQLSPNASRILIDLGLGPLLAPHVIAPESISIMTARTGNEIGRIPLGEAATLRYGAPYWIVRCTPIIGRVASEGSGFLSSVWGFPVAGSIASRSHATFPQSARPHWVM